jgi:hypothetical protein
MPRFLKPAANWRPSSRLRPALSSPKRPVAAQRLVRSLPAGQGGLALLARVPPVALAASLPLQQEAVVPVSRLLC